MDKEQVKKYILDNEEGLKVPGNDSQTLNRTLSFALYELTQVLIYQGKLLQHFKDDICYHLGNITEELQK